MRTSAQTTRTELIDSLLSSIGRLRRHFAGSLPAALHEHIASVTPLQGEALCALQRVGGGMTMHEFAAAQHCGMSSATALADRLVQHGLIERTTDPSDRRVVRLTPTAAAADITRQMEATRRTLAERLLAPLSHDEAETFVALLQRIVPDEEPAHE